MTNVNPGENWKAKYDAEPSGGTLLFKAGTHRIEWTAKLLKPMTFKGESGAVLEAVNPRDGKWMFVIERNGTGFTFDGLTLKGAGISCDSGGIYRNINVVNCTFDGMQHALRFADSIRDSNIQRNTFRNIRGYATINGYDWHNVRITHNRYIDCSHGGHILGPRSGVVLSNNYATGLENWLFEIQDSGDPLVNPALRSQGMLIENNVSHSYRKGYGNTGGLSVVNIGNGTIIRNNYLRADAAANLSESHLHTAIEWNVRTTNSTVEKNTVGSTRTDAYVWEMGIGYELTGITKNDSNRYFGKFGGGYGGNGKPTRSWPAGTNNTWDTNGANMPAPPSVESIIGGTTPPPIDPPPVDPMPPATQPVTITITSSDYKPATVTLEPK